MRSLETAAAWDGSDLPTLFTLDAIAPMHYRSRHGDANLNGRAYGGQVLGQTMMAASRTVDADRPATAMQFLFLQGTLPEQPVDFHVTALQDGKRFSSRHVRGTQGGSRNVFDAHLTFAQPVEAPRHAARTRAAETDPQRLGRLVDMPRSWDAVFRSRLGGYSLTDKPGIDFRVPDFDTQLDPATAGARIRFWMKTRRTLPAEPALHGAAFAYLSDWWLNFSSFAPHLRELDDERRLYVTSLNHGIWFHRPFHADEWLHVDSESPSADAGRGLSIGQVHDAQGELVATTLQESLMTYATPGTERRTRAA